MKFQATGPSIGRPTCTVVADRGDVYLNADSRKCVVIGPPITTSIRLPSYTGGSIVYEHDRNDVKRAFYMTCYGYPHDPNQHTVGQLDQLTQGVKLAVLDQPPGTTVTWELPPLTYTGNPLTQTHGAGDHTRIVNVDAEGAFQDKAPKAHFSYSDPEIPGGPFTYEDDSADTRVPSAKDNAPLVYQISGHQPGKLIGAVGPPLVNDPTPTLSYRPPDQGAASWTDYTEYTYLLVDAYGAQMPGVKVQERFTTQVPSSFSHNDVNQTWLTSCLSKISIDSHNFARDLRDGLFDKTDKLWFQWPDLNPPEFDATHVYYAGTLDPNPRATSGVFLGEYTIQYIPGTPGPSDVSNLQPGDPGSAFQKKTSPSP